MDTAAFDYILAADVLYHEEHFIELIETFLALSDEQTTIYLCYERRRKDLRPFLEILQQRGLVLQASFEFRIPREDIETVLVAHVIRKQPISTELT